MSYSKRWEGHSARWQREHTAAGESKTRWNRFLKLSPKTRKSVSISEYAKGVSVGEQRKSKSIQSAAAKVVSAFTGRKFAIEENTKLMSADELRWTLKATPEQIRRRAADRRYNRVVNGKTRNPWWYK